MASRGIGKKRARKDIPLQTKYKLIMYIERHPEKKFVHVAKEFSIPRSTLMGIVAKSGEIKRLYTESQHSVKMKRVRRQSFEEVDVSLLKWVCQLRSSKPEFPISCELLLDKANQFAQLHDYEGPVSMSWVERWKSRHGMVSKKLVGEASSIDQTVVDEWLTMKIPTLMADFHSSNIFNADETGLFWKLLPDHTLAFKKEEVRGGKRSKERITVLVGASMVGEKLPLLVIGRSKHPRSFPRDHSKLPVIYKNNQKSWMTGALFEEWVRDLDIQMKAQQREIVLVVDNCPAHPHITGLDNIQLVFLPPNTTAKTQPMDTGIIKNMKHHYRTSLAKKCLVAYEAGIQFNFELLKCMEVLQASWDCVTKATIANCYKKAGFLVTEEHAEEDNTDQLDDILDKMRRHVDIPAEVDGQWFITFDDDTEVANTLTDREIAGSFPQGTDDEVDDVPLTVVTASDAIKALDVLYQYAYQVRDSRCLITSLNTVEKLIECNVLESVQ